MTAIDPEFPQKVKLGDFIIAGRNFGRGQLHIQGPLSIKGLGLGLITESMVRSFYRLGVSAGILMLPFTEGISSLVDQGDKLQVDFAAGVIKNLSTGINVQTKPLPKFLLDIIAMGGEFAWLEANYGGSRKMGR